MNPADLQVLLHHTLKAQAQAPARHAVVCLCAAWCGTCTAFKTLFDQVAAAHPELVFRWVDIEDEADALGDIDVETFPTLVIGDAHSTRFAGPVLPQRALVEQLLRRLLT